MVGRREWFVLYLRPNAAGQGYELVAKVKLFSDGHRVSKNAVSKRSDSPTEAPEIVQEWAVIVSHVVLVSPVHGRKITQKGIPAILYARQYICFVVACRNTCVVPKSRPRRRRGAGLVS